MNIQKMMQQAQMMQTRMQELQTRLADVEVDGQSGGGMVAVRMTCKGDIRKITIDPSIINPADKETLEDLVAAAVNNARVNADQTIASETQKMMSELGLPSQ
ncbi:MAG: YbaB/EbfC family nucleoid-associated protein [Alphaproteobacteria bacterium]|nr:YbaB/EbfC family nucleoid-associated protein [Alphaproteobacteria bacterium]